MIDALPESVTSLWTRPKKKQRFAAPDDSDMQSVKTSAVSYCDSSNEIPIPAKAEEQVPSIARIILAGVRTLATGSAEDDDQPAVAINQANTVGAAQQSLCSASFATEMLDLPISTSKDWLHPVETVNELGADISLLDLASLPANNDSVQEYPAPTPYVSKVPSIANSEYAPEKQMGFLQMLLDSLQPDQKTQTPLPRSVSFSLLDPDSESPLGMQMGLLTGSPPSKATEYEIQKVIGMRQASSGREYLVHWVGYTIDEATWVPWDGGWTHDMDLIRDFHDRANKCPDLSDVDMYIDQGAESADTRSLDGEMDTWRTEAFQIEDPVDVDVISAATQAYDVAGKIQSMGKSPSQLFDDFMEETLFSPDCDYFPPALNSV